MVCALLRLLCFAGIALVNVAAQGSTDTNATLPVDYGMIVFPAFEALDVFGPLDALNILASDYPMNLHIISSTLDPVSTKPRSPAMNTHNSNFSQAIVPTHNFTHPPPKLDVLFVPGGMGTRAPAPELDAHIAFIRETYPSLQYIVSVCTGSWLLARAGVLDGKNATSNKRAWAGTAGLGNGTNWITHARWVQDGNIWTSSGVSAGIDGTLAWIAAVFGETVANDTANYMEYVRHLNASDDPFAELYGL
ncbi:dj-1 family protein [Moniliophthora roreri MCA 2997]|uniref:Dj-1 family protein n=2 Tax=Moniliophthora roreri TaxID=221103 RepID=V2YMI2_MONRO|nr:dj-1 family protein [Moniliophthora roreri MCA 2997]KAI3607773.1 dj-1 family protein [Moniliophthora roreri]